jgi:hypothetical protein
MVTKMLYEMKDFGCQIIDKKFKQDNQKNKKELELKKANYFEQNDYKMKDENDEEMRDLSTTSTTSHHKLVTKEAKLI